MKPKVPRCGAELCSSTVSPASSSPTINPTTQRQPTFKHTSEATPIRITTGVAALEAGSEELQENATAALAGTKYEEASDIDRKHSEEQSKNNNNNNNYNFPSKFENAL